MKVFTYYLCWWWYSGSAQISRLCFTIDGWHYLYHSIYATNDRHRTRTGWWSEPSDRGCRICEFPIFEGSGRLTSKHYMLEFRKSWQSGRSEQETNYGSRLKQLMNQENIKQRLLATSRLCAAVTGWSSVILMRSANSAPPANFRIVHTTLFSELLYSAEHPGICNKCNKY